jgi:hypothetical protein
MFAISANMPTYGYGARQRSINWKISPDVIWGKKYEKGKRKRMTIYKKN